MTSQVLRVRHPLGDVRFAKRSGGLLKITDYTTTPVTRNFVSYDANGNVMGLVDATTGAWNAQYELTSQARHQSEALERTSASRKVVGTFGEPIRASSMMGKETVWIEDAVPAGAVTAADAAEPAGGDAYATDIVREHQRRNSRWNGVTMQRSGVGHPPGEHDQVSPMSEAIPE